MCLILPFKSLLLVQVILVTSSLMTPAEARSNTNTQKVRLFSSDDLSKSCIDEMWDKVKVVCVQPFNKSQPYGLSFISFRTDDETKPADSGEYVNDKEIR